MAKHFKAVVRVTGGSEKVHENRIELSATEKSVTIPNPAPPPSSSTFHFDRVYAASENDKAVYKHDVKETVESTLLGYNGTIISLESINNREPALNVLVTQASEQIFRCLKESKRSRSAANLVVHCSFVAVADENVYDLLEDGANEPNGTAIPFTKLANGLSDASVHEAKSRSHVLALMKRGYKKEKDLMQWIMSQRSSLSIKSKRPEVVREHHTMLSLTVEYAHFGSMNAPISGTLSFLRLSSPYPLAHQQQYTVDKRVEKSALSLLALAELVNALTPASSGASETSHSPQRNGELYCKSLLTHILKDAVGGNCKTIFMCHVPEVFAESRCAEVGAALQLVSRARHIQNQPNKRDLAERALMAAYMKELKMQYTGGQLQGEREADSKKSVTDDDFALQSDKDKERYAKHSCLDFVNTLIHFFSLGSKRWN